MTPDLFDNLGETVFEDGNVLDEGYQPDSIVERENEIQSYQQLLNPILRGRNPSNIFVYGKTGVGKTAVTRYVLNAFQNKAESMNKLPQVYILFQNCNGESDYSILRRFINKYLIENSEKPFPKKGLSTSDALETFYNKIDEQPGIYLCVLDEIDHLSNLDNLMYELPRANANGYITNSKIGIIGISNNYKFRNALSKKAQDTLMEDEISFPTYNANELRTILNQRVKLAFKKDACDKSAIAKAAAIAAQDTGNARQALDLLSNGGDIADRENAKKVTDKHISEARVKVKRGRMMDKIRDQTMHAQLVLETIAKLDTKKQTPARTKKIYKNYKILTLDLGYEPLSSMRSVQNHLSDLTMLGFLIRTEQNEGRNGGYYHRYALDLDAESVIEARNKIEESSLN